MRTSWHKTTTVVMSSAAIASALALTTAGTAAANDRHHQANVAITQTNLISDQMGKAPLVDPSLVNAWGMSFGTGASATPLWVSDNGADVTTLYSGNTRPPAFAKVRTISIPAGAPTGQVFNASATEFKVTSGNASGPAKFIFASENGWIAGWNPNVPAPGSSVAQSVKKVKDAVFKGLTVANVNGSDFLFATDFHHGTVDVFDSNFMVQNWKGAFRDKELPHGYAPFNIALLDGKFYVTYALQDAAKHDDVAGLGHGFVDVFSTTGHLEKRLVQRGALDSPWGLAIAPSSWGNLAGDLLVGNFGNGRIHAYNPNTGAFEATLRDSHGRAIVIDGLWGLLPGNGVAANPQQVIFSAGPDGEKHGLVGILQATPKER